MKGERMIFMKLLIFRLINSFMLHTIFEPDEIWQNIEPINFILLKKGEMTWDWIVGIRSFVYVLLYFIPHYIIFNTFPKIYPRSCYFIVKIINALMSAVCDYYSVKIADLLNCNQKNILFLTIFSHGLWLYSPRSHINSLEMTLLVVTTYLVFAFEQNITSEKKFKISMIFSTLVCYLRPSSSAFIIILFLKHIYRCLKNTYLIILTFIGLVLIDTYVYGEFIIPPLNFLTMNIYHKVSELFGTLPFYVYFPFLVILAGISPLIAFINLFQYLKAARNTINIKFDNDKDKFLLKRKNLIRSQILQIGIMCLAFFAFYSMIGHKEMRFLIPLIPFINILVSIKIPKFYKLIVFSQLVFSIYVGIFYQEYKSTIDFIREECSNSKNKILIATCPYSLPLYSFLPYKNLEFTAITGNLDIYQKVKDIKKYSRFGSSFKINEYAEFLSDDYKTLSYDNYNYVLMYDWMYEKTKLYLANFEIIKITKYCIFKFEKEKGKLIFILRRINS